MRTPRLLLSLMLSTAGCATTNGPADEAPAVTLDTVSESSPREVRGRYQDLLRAYGGRRALELGLLREGEPFVLTATSPNGGTPEGLRILLDGVPVPQTRTGEFSIPVSAELFDLNPELLLRKGSDDPVQLKNLQTFHLDCHLFDRSSAMKQVSVSKWTLDELDSGDGIYAAPGAASKNVTSARDMLVRIRSELESTLGAPVPPISVAVVKGKAPASANPSGGTPAKRPVWLLDEAPSDELLLGTLPHEWGHAILDLRRFPDGSRIRYLEDGLMDWVGHHVQGRIRNTRTTTTLSSRLATLEAIEQPDAPVDLLALGQDYQGEDVTAWLEANCRADATKAYALALGYWLAWAEGNPEKWRALFERLRTRPLEDEASVLAYLKEVGPKGLDPQAFTPNQAIAALKKEMNPSSDVASRPESSDAEKTPTPSRRRRARRM